VIWLLDTNMLVYARNGQAPVVARLDQAWEQGDVVTSLLAVGELIYGAEKKVHSYPCPAVTPSSMAWTCAFLAAMPYQPTKE